MHDSTKGEYDGDDEKVVKKVEELMGPPPDEAPSERAAEPEPAKKPAKSKKTIGVVEQTEQPPAGEQAQVEPSTAPALEGAPAEPPESADDWDDVPDKTDEPEGPAAEAAPDAQDASATAEVPAQETPAPLPASKKIAIVDGSGTEAPVEVHVEDPEAAAAEPAQTERAATEAWSKPVPAEAPQEEPEAEALQPEEEAAPQPFLEPKTGVGTRLKDFLAGVLHSRKLRWAALGLLVAGVIALGAVPTTRYMALNTAGVRSSASLVVIDSSTRQPLRNVQVSLDGQTGLTDDSGKVRLQQLRLGKHQLSIHKRAFADINQPVTIGWGSNPLGEMQLVPAGLQYTFMLHDFLSDKPIVKAEATAGEYSAFSDDSGKLVLTIEETGVDEFEVVMRAQDYREETIRIGITSKETQQLKLVPARPHVFVSKRSGTYDLYKIDVDGKNETLLLKGTGNERDDLVLAPYSGELVAALVSTRDNERNSDGYLLSSLTLIDIATGKTENIAQSERIQIVDWVGSRIVYVRIVAGASAADPQRHRLVSYDFKTGESTELAASNYFNDVLVAGGEVYYAPSQSGQDTGGVGLHRISPHGGKPTVILGREAWNIVRSSYDTLSISANRDWFRYTLGQGEATQQSGPPANNRTRIYIDSPDKKHSLWVDERDGKGTLLVYDIERKQDTTLKQQSGLKNPLYWLSNKHIVYRIHTDTESADYAINTEGGEPRKVGDVTNTGGIDQWYYY